MFLNYALAFLAHSAFVLAEFVGGGDQGRGHPIFGREGHGHSGPGDKPGGNHGKEPPVKGGGGGGGGNVGGRHNPPPLHGGKGKLKWIPHAAARRSGLPCTASVSYPKDDESVRYWPGDRVVVKQDAAHGPAGFSNYFAATQSTAVVNLFQLHSEQPIGKDPQNRVVFERNNYVAPKVFIDNRSNKQRTVWLGVYDETADLNDPKTRPDELLAVTANPFSHNDDCTVFGAAYIDGTQYTVQVI